MAPSRLATALLTTLASATGALAQTTTITALLPDVTTELLTASVISVDPAKSETALLINCPVSSAGSCILDAATYRTSPGGIHLDGTVTGTSANVTSGTTNFILTSTGTYDLACPQVTNNQVVCDGNVSVAAWVGNITNSVSSSTKTTYTTNFSAPITITAGNLQGGTGTPTTTANGAATTSSKTGGAAIAQMTQNAVLAGAAMAVLGGALLA